MSFFYEPPYKADRRHIAPPIAVDVHLKHLCRSNVLLDLGNQYLTKLGTTRSLANPPPHPTLTIATLM